MKFSVGLHIYLGARSLSLDAAGDRTSVHDSVNGTTSYTLNSDNQYSNVGGNGLTYDGRGNLATYNGWTYSYDADGRLLSGSNGMNTCTCAYDPLGRCVSRVQNGTTSYYVYDLDWFMLADYNANGTQNYRYVQGAGSDEILTIYQDGPCGTMTQTDGPPFPDPPGGGLGVPIPTGPYTTDPIGTPDPGGVGGDGSGGGGPDGDGSVNSAGNSGKGTMQNTKGLGNIVAGPAGPSAAVDTKGPQATKKSYSLFGDIKLHPVGTVAGLVVGGGVAYVGGIFITAAGGGLSAPAALGFAAGALTLGGLWGSGYLGDVTGISSLDPNQPGSTLENLNEIVNEALQDGAERLLIP